MASQQTNNVRKIISNIELSLAASCISYPAIMMNCIMDEAQELIDGQGYAYDVAIAIACKIYPATRYCAQYLYEK